MDNTIKKNIVNNESFSGLYLWFFMLLFFTTFGYFVYGGIDGVFGILLLVLLYSLSVTLSIIPLCGMVIHGLIMLFVINPWVYDYTGIHSTLLTFVLFWIYFILGCIITAGISYMVFVHKK